MLDNDIKSVKVGSCWNGSSFVPLVRLKGKWLNRYGYSVGTTFRILLDNDNSMILEKLNPPVVPREVLPF
jgi:hypothetical protein